MGKYEDLVEATVEAVLEPGAPLTLGQIAEAAGRVAPQPFQDVTVILLVLQAHPERFIEVSPGLWARRDDGPEAGVHSSRRRPPLAGGAAVAVAVPEATELVEAIAVAARPNWLPGR